MRYLTLVVALLITGCSTTGSSQFLSDLRSELAIRQNDEEVRLYAAEELRIGENHVIAAINAWNDGSKDQARELAQQAHLDLQAIDSKTKQERALGLDRTAWEQRKYLQDIRKTRMGQ